MVPDMHFCFLVMTLLIQDVASGQGLHANGPSLAQNCGSKTGPGLGRAVKYRHVHLQLEWSCRMSGF